MWEGGAVVDFTCICMTFAACVCIQRTESCAKHTLATFLSGAIMMVTADNV